MGALTFPNAPDLDWLPHGNRELIQAASLIRHRQECDALRILIVLADSSPWLKPLCRSMAQHALLAKLEHRQPAAVAITQGSWDEPDVWLAHVVEHPTHTVRINTAEEPAFRLAALYQLIWDAQVSVELSLDEYAACQLPGMLTADEHQVLMPGGQLVHLNGRDQGVPALERPIRLTLAREWLLAWRPWGWLSWIGTSVQHQLSPTELPRHWLQARALTHQLLLEERRRLNWEMEASRPREAGLVSIVIPVWGAGDQLAGCLRSLRQIAAQPQVEIILVDNGNTDPATCAVLSEAPYQDRRVRMVRNPRNYGFALGCNLGFSASRGQHVLFLNSDAQVNRDALSPLVEALEDPSCRAAQPALITPSGRIQCLGIVFGSASPLGIALHAGAARDSALMHPRRVPAVTAACVLLRACEFAAVKGFDVAYLNGQEDTDLCLRLTARFGGSCAVVPSSEVIHPEGSSPGRYRYIEANRSRMIARWPIPDSGSLERAIEPDGLRLVGFRSVDRVDRPRWLHAPQPVLRPDAAVPSAAEGC
ncbi:MULTISPECIES: glycosyltransferase family 2 protein [Aphanothece]|uniref:glycosyltransferase family 2 protein n=1 Tax=Aphanothece TaxID=1121 RepID=UPI00398F7B46